MVLPLDQVGMGTWGSVTEVNTGKYLQQRLRDFGLIPGTRVRRRYASPAGDVVAIELRGSVLALRNRDLHRIQVRV